MSSDSGPRPPGSIIVHARPYGEALAAGLRSFVPADESILVCPSGDSVPVDAQVLVTLLDDPATIRELLVPSIEWVHVLGAGAHDDVVWAGHILRLRDTGDLRYLPCHVGGFADLCLDEDVCLHHGVLLKAA